MSFSLIKEKPLSSLQSHSSQQDQQPRLVCTWSAHTLRFGPSKSSFPREYHTLSATAAGKLFLFGGHTNTIASNYLYVISTRDFSTTLFQTNGEVPSPRGGHDAALISTYLLIWGGRGSFTNRDEPVDDSIRLLNLVSREWTSIAVNGPGPRGRYHHTVTMVGSKFFVFGGQINRTFLNDMWALDLNSLNSQPVWESYKPTPGNEKFLPRSAHVSVATEDHIIVFGGYGNAHYYNDTWSFSISTRKWTELQCTGSIPSPRADHAAVLVDGVMYVYGGFASKTYLDDLYALQLSTQRWFKIHNLGTSPLRRAAHAMASDGTRIFVLGGYSQGARTDEVSLIHVFDTKDMKYPEPECNTVDPNEKITQLARKSSPGPLTQEQPQHPKSSSSEAHGASRRQSATPAVSGHPTTVQIAHERNSGLNGRPLEFTDVNSKPRRVPEGDVTKGSTEYDAKFAAPHSSKGEQPRLVCTWSAHAPQSGPSILPFPRYYHTLSATVTAAGKLFLFGGHISSNDLYVISTRDFSTSLLQTSGEVPSPRDGHEAALTSTHLLIWGGKPSHTYQGRPLGDSLHLLNLVTREWTRIVANGPGPRGRYHHTMTMVDSKLFVFGGQNDRCFFNDMWALNLNSLKSQPVWESYERTSGNVKPSPRSSHVSVTTEDHIIVFGGYGRGHYYNDTWLFNISTRKWTELQCTGSIPSPRTNHAAVLVDDVMYVFGGFTGKTYLDDLYALQLSTQRWFKLHNVGKRPLGRSAHAMASDGTRVFVLGGFIDGAPSEEISLIHVFDTKDIKYPEPERNAVDPNEVTTQLARKSSPGPLTEEQSQHPKSSSSEAHGTSRLQKATPTVSGRPATVQITHKRNPGLNDRSLKVTGVNSKPRRVPEDDVREGSADHAKFVAPHTSSEGEVTRLELRRQLLKSHVAQTERDQRIALLTDELALKSTLLEEAKANATEVAKRAGLELRQNADRLLTQTSLVKQRDAELVDIQARLDELLLSHNQHIGQYEKELANVRAKLEANESELEAVRLRLMDSDAEKGWTKSKAEADTIHAQTATGSVNRDGDQMTRRLIERVQAIEAEMASRRLNEKA